jgi:peptide-methionine (R)-S-oxide reductase
MAEKVVKSNAQWKKELTPDQYRILRQRETEKAYSGKYNRSKDEGVYRCAGCGNVLFDSNTKFDWGTGWPSFSAPAGSGSVSTRVDDRLERQTTEVICKRCGGHLGHVFGDGPQPSGLRYCINSAALTFIPADRV